MAREHPQSGFALGRIVSGLRILYLAHDLADAAVARRVAMLQDGGATVALAGFARRNVEDVAGVHPTELGRSREGRMLHRLRAVGGALVTAPTRIADIHADVIVARNLEMLVLAHRLSRGKFPVIYECLDIHRLMLGGGPVALGLRALERKLARRSALLLTSSSAFVERHFRPSGIDLPIELVENRVFDPSNSGAPLERIARKARGPITIGWFGALRCRRSFEALARFTRATDGRFQVIMRGRPAIGVLDDLEHRAADEPYMRFQGPYAYPDDLASIYAEVDLTWAVDFYEAGQNSDWLLPNRLYEGGLYGAVPIAVAGNETHRFLDRHAIGVTLPSLDLGDMLNTLGSIDASAAQQLHAAVTALPRSTWLADRGACRDLVERLRSAADPTQRVRTPRKEVPA